MDTALVYVEDGPNWRVADQRLAPVAAAHPAAAVTDHRVAATERDK